MILISIENVILDPPIFDASDEMSELDVIVLVQVWVYKDKERLLEEKHMQ